MIGMFSQEDDGVTIWGPARGRSPLPQQVFLYFYTSSPYLYSFPSFMLILTFRLPAWPLLLLSSGQLPLAVLNFQEVPAIYHLSYGDDDGHGRWLELPGIPPVISNLLSSSSRQSLSSDLFKVLEFLPWLLSPLPQPWRRDQRWNIIYSACVNGILF